MKMRVPRGADGELTPFVFDAKELARAYRAIQPVILADINVFCKGDEDGFDRDPYQHAFNTGKRAVWQYINSYLKLDPEQIEQIYMGRGRLVLTEQEIIDG